jgi:hypothetical protein
MEDLKLESSSESEVPENFSDERENDPPQKQPGFVINVCEARSHLSVLEYLAGSTG